MQRDLMSRLYREMLRIRLIEEGIVERYHLQEMRCPVHLSIGQEAVAVGACAALGDDDRVFSGHRSHGHYLAKGGDLRSMLAEIHGKADGCTQGFGGSMHLIDLEAGFQGAVPIVGATIPIGVGSAFASLLDGSDQVSMIFLGDGACETGVFHESLNFAVLHNLAAVFVVENNLYSVYSPLEVRQPAANRILDMAAGHGVAVDGGDGNDVAEVHQKTRAAVDNARHGKGPALLEFSTYRWREHCGPNYDNDLGYRTPEEFEKWRDVDPLAKCEAGLLEQNIATPEDLDTVRHELMAEIDAAFEFAQQSPFPLGENSSRHVYAE